MSVLAEQPYPGEASFDFVQKGTARRKWVRRRKGISKTRALPVSHISPWNILPGEVAGTSPPLRGLERGRQAVRTCPKMTGAILGGCAAKSAVTISHLKFPLFWNPFLSGICKLRRKKKNSGRTLTPIAGCWGFWYNLWVPQSTQNIFPIQRYL